jgi:diaminopimelate decarboxylase
MTGVATQFGVDEEDAPETLARIAALPGLMLDGLHFYAGSNALDAGAIGANMQNCVDLALTLSSALGRAPRRLIFGSGFGVAYHDGQKALDLADAASQVRMAVVPLWALPDVAIDLELGRWLVAPAGRLLIRVLTRKSGRGATIAICDGGFNAHMAACGMMGSVVRRNWPISNLSAPEAPREKVTLAGPLCTSIDLLARDLEIARAMPGDVLAVGLSGAYGPTASPQGFISQPEVREIIWNGLTLRDETPGPIPGQIQRQVVL